MIPKSIRWTLLFWYAVTLVIAIAALGWALHTEMERNLYRDTDTQLEFWISRIIRGLDRLPSDFSSTEIVKFLPDGVTVSVSNTAGVSLLESAGFSTNGIAEEWSRAKLQMAPESSRILTWRHMRGSARRTAEGQWIVVAINARDQHHRIRDFLTVLLAAGAGILVLAIAGGWFLVCRALAPLERITKTAVRISGDNLGERIPTQGTQNELGELAHTLNDSFDRLEQSFAQQARFTADASHELRTPLTIILSHLELARQDGRSKSDLVERVGICREAALRMRSVVEGLLTLARADAGALLLIRSAVDLSELIVQVRDSMAPLSKARGLIVDLKLEPVTLHADRDRLREVVTNLYSNAIRYNQQYGRIQVSISSTVEGVSLKIEDTGHGIHAEDLPQIFERFYRSDKARAFATRGAGLGLAITREIVELHGGSISVTSEMDQGSAFTVCLPGPPLEG